MRMYCWILYCKVGCCCLVSVCGSCSNWASKLTSTIEIDPLARIYIQKNAWHPREGKCHVLRRRRRTRALILRSETPYTSKGCFWVKSLAMR